MQVWAQPQANAVTNAADYTPTLAPGAIATIFGAGLASATDSASSIPLPTTLSSTSVQVNGTPSPLFYVSATQINFQIPFETKAGVASLTVTNSGQQSPALQFVVAAFSPGIFGFGGGHGAIQNQDYSPNAPANPAAVGSSIIVYITGIGIPDTQVGDGAAAPGSSLARFPGSSAATIGDVDAPVQFIGLTPGSVGLAQINLQVPALPTGEYPLWISLNGMPSVSALVSVSGSAGGFQVSSLLKLVSSFSLPGLGPTLVPGITGVVDNSVAWSGNHLYVCSPSDIKIIDVTNPAAPNFVQTIAEAQFSATAHNCTVNSSAAKPFLTDLIKAGPAFALYDLTNPAMPVKTALKPLLVVPRAVAYSGNTGFFGEDLFSYFAHDVNFTRGEIVSVDLSNLKAPVVGPLLTSDPAHPETNTSHSRFQMMVPAPNVLYAASTTAINNFLTSTGALDIFDITNPKSIKGIGQILVPGSRILHSVTASGSELLALGDTTGFGPGNLLPGGELDFPFTGYLTLTMFDITDPRNPKMQGNTVVNSMRPSICGGPVSLGTVALGSGFYAVTCAAPDLNATGTSGNGSLIIVDARDPQNPQAFTYGTLPGLGGLTVANGYLFAAVGSGANIYQIEFP